MRRTFHLVATANPLNYACQPVARWATARDSALCNPALGFPAGGLGQTIASVFTSEIHGRSNQTSPSMPRIAL